MNGARAAQAFETETWYFPFHECNRLPAVQTRLSLRFEVNLDRNVPSGALKGHRKPVVTLTRKHRKRSEQK